MGVDAVRQTIEDLPSRMRETKAAMQTSHVRSAVHAAMSSAAALGLGADDAVILQNSNRLTVRLMPCDVVSRIAPTAYQAAAEFEVGQVSTPGAPPAPPPPSISPRAHPTLAP